MNTPLALSALVAVSSVWLLLRPTGSGFGRGAAVAPGRPHLPDRGRGLLSAVGAVQALLPKAAQSPAGELTLVALIIGSVVKVGFGFGLVVTGAVFGIGWLERRRTAARDRQRLDEALPESIDLCTVVLGSGGTIRDCLDALAKRGPYPVRPLAGLAMVRADGPDRLDQALRWLQLALGPSFQPLTGALLLASEQGGAVGVLLARLAVEANASRRRIGELAARRLPVALLVPLVVCSLPAVIVGTVIPLALVTLADLDL